MKSQRTSGVEFGSVLMRAVRPQYVAPAWLMITGVLTVALALDASQHSVHAIRTVVFWTALAMLLLFAAVVFALAAGLIRKLEVAARVGFAAVFGVFGYGTIDGFVIQGPLGRRLAVLSLTVTLLLVAAVLALGRSYIVVGTFAILVLAFAADGAGTAFRLSQAPQEPQSVVMSVSPAPNRPDVLIVVLDAHPRADVAEQIFNADMSQFHDDLAEMGFSVSDSSWSNYSQTYVSIASMLALDTLVAADADVYDYLPNIRSANAGDGELFRAFGSAGYDITMMPSVWPGSRCGGLVDTCVYTAVPRSTAYGLLRRTAFGPLISRVLVHPWTDTSIRQLDSLARTHIESSSGDQPNLTWAHIGLPHSPLLLNEECDIVNEEWRLPFYLTAKDDFNGERKAAFAEQLTCVDRITAKQIREVLENDPDTVVILLSDHGPDSQHQADAPLGEYSGTQTWERLANLIAVRGPSECLGLESYRSPLAALRAVTACLLEAELVEVSERFYVVPQEIEVVPGLVAVETDVDYLP